MMGSVVSATTGAVYGRGARVSKADQFLAAAEELIGLAHDDFEAGRHDVAMENAYRAALRVAGARNVSSPIVRKRKRLPTSAWDKLALTGGAHWASVFKRYSAQRGRVASGIETDPGAAVVHRLLSDAEEFYLSTRAGEMPMVA
ncbi:SAV_6107 family HEPN domain-containing protein [Corynebacterium afermentans]|uniref:SAV_6107 family HEPN domain-containing protein n=1 Tax=Corynebacterium afermentans TaxID=38286 RepID=UPI00257423EA|nr:SAV_6107 family HEPN domain-containing protein [Corynebacterium afermentans]MCG7273928.1 SAV_6107 family HEPN domain-containing protein [Corynebacterium afermentans]